jgi:6-pyruvoyltetrahydropterin/6-carboxytetrahydropterin synthase
MVVTISKKFDFDAAHWLPNVPDGHKCKRLHGHTYEVEVRCRGEVASDSGWFIDYQVIANAWATVHDMVDHRCLNDIGGLENPTTEVLAPWIAGIIKPLLPEMVSVRVYESSTTWCEYEVP